MRRSSSSMVGLFLRGSGSSASTVPAVEPVIISITTALSQECPRVPRLPRWHFIPIDPPDGNCKEQRRRDLIGWSKDAELPSGNLLIRSGYVAAPDRYPAMARI